MKKENLLFLLSVLTILVIRIGLLLFPNGKVMIGHVHFHHLWIGLTIVILTLLLFKKFTKLRLLLFSIGLGAMVDEAALLFLGVSRVGGYWQTYSVVGVCAATVFVFILRKQIVKVV